MVEKISKKLTDRLLSRNVINEEDYEIYQYGLELLFANFLNVLTLLVAELILEMLWQGVVFVLSFMLLRRYAGGYHSSTSLRCYLSTNFVILSTLSVMKYIKIDIFIYLGLFVVSSIIILVLSPVEAVNKELDEVERVIYRKRTFVLWFSESLLAVLALLLNCQEVSVCIFMADILLCLSLLIGRMKLS